MHEPITGMQRNFPLNRVAAYLCVESTEGIQKGKRVKGWYGTFNEDRLISELRPKVAEYVDLGEASYPILITSYQLEPKTTVRFEGDVKFDRRTRKSPEKFEAVIRSGVEHLLLSDCWATR